MMELEKQALDRWADKEKIEVSHWPHVTGTGTPGRTYEARTWKDGRPVRRLADDRHEALQGLKDLLARPSPHDSKPPALLCAHCPAGAAHTFHVCVDSGMAAQVGLTQFGKYVPTGGFMGGTDEELSLCVGCIVTEFERMAFKAWNSLEWAEFVKRMREKKP